MSIPATPVDPQQENPHTDLLHALSALRFTSKYSDLLITCNFRQWSVHKAIVCSRSGFFDGACSSTFREGNTGVIDLSEDDEEAVGHMINFFYHLDYLNEQAPSVETFQHRARSDARRKAPKKIDLSTIQDPLLMMASSYAPASPQTPPLASTSECYDGVDLPQGKMPSPKMRPQTPPTDSDADSVPEASDDSEVEDNDRESHLVQHTRVYALAEKYDVPSLKQLAKSKFEMAMACWYDSPEFAHAIEEVYCSTVDSDRGLRDVVLETFRCHPQLASTQDVYEVIKDTPTLARELFKVERGIPVY